MKAQDESVIQPIVDPYKKHKVVINGTTYFTKLDRKTNKPLYKKQFSVSIPGVKNPPRPTTKEWRTSITKVNQDVEKMRSEIRSGDYSSVKKEKHLYEEVVNELYEKRVEECKSQNKSFETIEKYLSNNKNYVLSSRKGYPSFKNKFIEDLTINDVKELKRNIISYALKNDLSKLTVSHIFTNIDRTLIYAGESQYIKDELANNVKIAPVGAKERKKTTIKNYLLKNEYDEMMAVFDTSFQFSREETQKQNEYRKMLYKTFIECGYKLGFRKGEGFALKWKNYLGDSIVIESTLNSKGVKKHLENTSVRVINPKTESSIRIMKTPASIKKYLDEWKEYCLSLGMDVSDDTFIFRELDNKPFNPTTFARRLRTIIDESGIEKKYDKHIYPHSFRHSCCSFLIQKLREKDKEISLREIYIAVASYLGHSSDKMVMEVYGHLYPNTEKSLISQVLDEM